MKKIGKKLRMYLRKNKATYLLLLLLLLPFFVIIPEQKQSQSGYAATPSLAVDVQVGTTQATASPQITSPKFNLNGNELVVVFLAGDGPASSLQTFSSVAGGGLHFSLAKRANRQKGTAEVWYAYTATPISNVVITAKRGIGSYHGMMQIASFTGATNTIGAVAEAGAATGAESVEVTTTVANAWVWGVGNDWDNAVARTPGANQTLVRQLIDTKIGDTYWTQKQNARTPIAGTFVSINDTAPTTDQWNLVAVEITPLQATVSLLPTATPIPLSGVTNSPPSSPIPSVGSSSKNCATNPSGCGYPDQTNTGWQHTGVTLKTVYQDPYYIDTEGAVIDGLDIHGCVSVRAKNVTITRSKITCGNQPMVKNFEPDGNGGLIDIGAGLVMQDVEFDGQGNPDSSGVAFDSYKVIRGNFHNIGTAVRLGNNVDVEDSYVHDIAFTTTSHNGGFPSDGGSGIIVRHNTVLMNTQNGFPIALYNAESPGVIVQNVVVDNNLLAGGNYIFYCGSSGNTSPNLSVTNNRLSKLIYSNGGYYGATAGCEGAAIWSNNYWDDTLAPVGN